MSYFNHSFSKRFLATGVTRNALNTGAVEGVTNPFSDGGLITTAGVASSTLSEISLGGIYTPGYVMFADKNYQSLNESGLATACCEVYIISTSLLAKDKIGSHGGYRETNKSKLIKPKYVHRAYKVEDCMPQQSVTSIGTTTETVVPGLPATGFQGGTLQSDCQKDFYCDETYYLRIDIKGSPALRFLNHNAYQTVTAYTGCCAAGDLTPDPVDPTTVYISWANEILSNPYIKDFVLPVVFDTTGTAWFAPGTTLDPFTGLPFVGNTWDNYTPVAGVAGLEAGMRLFGAYVDTKFLNCTFQVTDFFEKSPIRILASLVDYTGDPCVFEGLCVYNDCLGIQGNGFGEQVLRDVILSESYLQNFVANNDFRIREITQGTDIIDSVNRNAMYTRYYIQHVVPRFNNPSGVFDNDRYMLEIITPTGGNATLETYLSTWLDACNDCTTFDTDEFGCTTCDIEPNVPLVP